MDKNTTLLLPDITHYTQWPYAGLENRAIRLPQRELLVLYRSRARQCWCIPVCFPKETVQVWGGGCALVKAVVLLTAASWAGLGLTNDTHILMWFDGLQGDLTSLKAFSISRLVCACKWMCLCLRMCFCVCTYGCMLSVCVWVSSDNSTPTFTIPQDLAES